MKKPSTYPPSTEDYIITKLLPQFYSISRQVQVTQLFCPRLYGPVQYIEYLVIEIVPRKVQPDQVRQSHLRNDQFQVLTSQIGILIAQSMNFRLNSTDKIRSIFSCLCSVDIISVVEAVSEGNDPNQANKTLNFLHRPRNEQVRVD